MAAARYRVAVVGGAGTWGRHYLRAYANHPDCEIVGLVDHARERRAAFAQRYGIARQCDSVEELLAGTVPDVVSAIVPVGQNFPVVKACAEAGVRVVSCEKPISAELAEADAMVDTCREHGVLLGCGQAACASPYMPQIIDWIRAGHIGRITGVAIPGGLPVELSGTGCVQLSALRIVTGQDPAWVEGWELEPVPTYVAPDTDPIEADVPGYGRVGLADGTVCDIPMPGPRKHSDCFLSITGETGQVWLARPRPVLIRGRGPEAVPVSPEFLEAESLGYFEWTVQRLFDAADSGQEPLSSGDDYRHALETAIALKLSAAAGHARVELPLPDRSHRLLPHPYRLFGGDVAGWESIGYSGPPRVPLELQAVATFQELEAVDFHELRRLLQSVDPGDLAMALMGFEGSLRRRLVHGLPEGLRGKVQEGIEVSGAPDEAAIEAARQRIVELAQRL